MLSLEKCSYCLCTIFFLLIQYLFVLATLIIWNLWKSQYLLVIWIKSYLKFQDLKLQLHLKKKIRFLIQMFYKGKAPSGKDNHLVYTYKKMLQNIHEYVHQHLCLKGHEFEQALGVGDGQGSLLCCSPQRLKELDTTE